MHSPAPWKARPLTGSEETPFFVVAGRRLVATVYGTFDVQESHANAVLISTAPEMLEALERLMALCEKNGISSDFAQKVANKARCRHVS